MASGCQRRKLLITAAVEHQPLWGGAPPLPQAGVKQARPLRGLHTCCLTRMGPSYSSPLFCPPPSKGGHQNQGRSAPGGPTHAELQIFPLRRGKLAQVRVKGEVKARHLECLNPTADFEVPVISAWEQVTQNSLVESQF